ncbi:hypothetical protein ACTA71_009995 [Dictyostelium dimigraforme]
MHYSQDITLKQHISLLSNAVQSKLLSSTIDVANYKLSSLSHNFQLLKYLISVDPSNRDNYIEQIKSLHLEMDHELKIASDYVKEVHDANSEQPETFVDTAIIEEELVANK